jgi:hypothetical protein
LAATAPAAAPMANHLAAQDAAAAGDAQGVVAFTGEGGGLLAFVGEVGLGSGELRLAGFAVDGEVVERFQVFSGDYSVGFGRWRIWRSWCGLQNDWGWQGELAGEVVDDLHGGDDGALLGGERGEGLRELGVKSRRPKQRIHQRAVLGPQANTSSSSNRT